MKRGQMGPARDRGEQLGYSDQMSVMLDEDSRRHKARKLIAVLKHALGRADLDGLTALDVGCSAGFIADELVAASATTHGVDIDEPGLARAIERFGDRVTFQVARGEDLPFADESVDIVVLNHIYEHVVDPQAVIADIHRVLRPGGVIYLGAAHRWQFIEPHHRLPLLSWLPQAAADRYMQVAGKGDHYYERFETVAGLRRLMSAFSVWDYTLPVLADPIAFAGDDVVPAAVSRMPAWLLTRLLPIVPTYIWVGFKGQGRPACPPLGVGPRPIQTP